MSQLISRLPRKILPALNRLKNVRRTAREHSSSRVNRVRSQSQEQPISRSWLKIRFSYSSFQAQIRWTRASRPRSCRVFFSSSQQPLLDDRLGGDAGVVGAGHPEDVVALHPPPADQDVLQGVIERMAQVQRTGDVRRRNHDAVGRPRTGRIGVEIALLDPELVKAVLGVLGIVLLGEVEFAHGSNTEFRSGTGRCCQAGLSSKSRSQSTMIRVSSSTP